MFVFIPFQRGDNLFLKKQHNLFVTSSHFTVYILTSRSGIFLRKCLLTSDAGFFYLNFLSEIIRYPQSCVDRIGLFTRCLRSSRCCIVKTSRSLWRTNRLVVEQSHLKLRAEKSGHSIIGLFSAMGRKALFARRPKIPLDEITPG